MQKRQRPKKRTWGMPELPKQRREESRGLTDSDLFDEINLVLFYPVCASISERCFGSPTPVRDSGREGRLSRQAVHLRRPPPDPRGRSGRRRTEVDSDE